MPHLRTGGLQRPLKTPSKVQIWPSPDQACNGCPRRDRASGANPRNCRVTPRRGFTGCHLPRGTLAGPPGRAPKTKLRAKGSSFPTVRRAAAAAGKSRWATKWMGTKPASPFESLNTLRRRSPLHRVRVWLDIAVFGLCAHPAFSWPGLHAVRPPPPSVDTLQKTERAGGADQSFAAPKKVASAAEVLLHL